MTFIEPSVATSPGRLERDRETGLVLAAEVDALLRVIRAQLPLPYSVTEYGCGKKASVILGCLLDLDVPPHALRRGLLLERDLSPRALAEEDYRRRPHALVADNPLAGKLAPDDEPLRRILEDVCEHVSVEDGCIRAGPYRVHDAPRVQFRRARSHVFVIVALWDPKRQRVVEWALDPSLAQRPLAVSDLRLLCAAPEALCLSAPLFGRFRLEPHRLTDAQNRDVEQALDAMDRTGASLEELDREEHGQLLRSLTGAEPGGIGDPATWSYANNLVRDHEHDREQLRRTGVGETLRAAAQRLFRARERRSDSTQDAWAAVARVMTSFRLDALARSDAQWSKRELSPLAELTTTLAYYDSLRALHETLAERCVLDLEEPELVERYRGFGVRLRHRIERLADASVNGDEIDARVFTPGFLRASLETIEQMEEAGLTVFVDRVGSLHGLLLSDDEIAQLRRGALDVVSVVRSAVAHVSHIDTVHDAGRFDGRLGVASGIETAHTLSDLARYFDQPLGRGAVRLMVSAYIGEEMTYTGEGVSMPGSAAVAEHAAPQAIDEMRNGRGERWRNGLLAWLEQLRDAQDAGRIRLANRFDADSLLDACYAPDTFYPEHSYERHIEQGPILDEVAAPSALVDVVMGIHQRDYYLDGDDAEATALELAVAWRELALAEHEREGHARVTVGTLEADPATASSREARAAWRVWLEGERDHAGATRLRDRRDACVAAGRLAKHFRGIVEEASARTDALISGCVGEIELRPGSDRNAIPGGASLTLGLVGEASDEAVRWVREALESFLAGTLCLHEPSEGREGLRDYRVEERSAVALARSVRLSIDLRAESTDDIDRLRQDTEACAVSICHAWRVRCHSESRQNLSPRSMRQAGRVLLMERSYGGSHNPDEAELLSDLTRGMMLQLSVMTELLAREEALPEDFNLYHWMSERIPRSWRERLESFTSGALHDSCNLAAASGVH